MKYYDLKSELAICQIFGNFGLPEYCLLINECDNEFCKIVVFDSSDDKPYKYCKTWKKNLIPFPDDEETKYRNIFQPRVVNVNSDSVQISIKGRNYVLRFVDDLMYAIGQRIMIIDPTNPLVLKHGTVEDVISDEDYLLKNNFIPKYKVKLDNGDLSYFGSYQISEIY